MLRGSSSPWIRRRRRGLAIGAIGAIVALLVLGAGAFEGTAPAQTTQARPNVVLVMTDDQTVEQMRALERVRGQIGRAGTTFTRNFSTFPLCCPSRATYLTGQYSHNHGVQGNMPPEGGFYKLDSRNTLPVWLRDAGYATAHIGKYLNGYGTRDPRQVPAGWQEWQGSVDPTTYNFFNYCLNENGKLVTYGRDPRLNRACPNATQRPSAYQGDLYSRKAVGYINRRAPATKPFFLSVAYLAPHGGGPNDGERRCLGSAKPAPRHRGAFASAPLPRPPGFNEPDVSDKPGFIRRLPRLGSRQIDRIRTDYQCRRESLLAVDEGVGAMVKALRAKGELENTLFIFTADNGFFQGEHRVQGGKLKVYEPSVRVPALMRGPGVPRDKRVDQLTGNIDLASTIVDAADAKPRRTLDGVSLLKLAPRPSLFAGRDIVLQNGPRGGPGNPRYRAIRTSRYKYVEYVTGERELYDLLYDPYEQRSLHNSPRHAEVRQRLARRLARLADCSGAGCRR
jgi:arylsulfatase A-like enzyme